MKAKKVTRVKNKYTLQKVKFGYQLMINRELVSAWFGKELSQEQLDALGEFYDNSNIILHRS